MADAAQATPMTAEPVAETPREAKAAAVRTDRARAIKRLDRLADLLDSRFRIFGFRFGLDGILSILPVAGDLLAASVSLYIVAEAMRLGARKRTIARMLLNVGVDTLFGSVPLAGTVFDVIFKANNRNIRLLKEELGREV